MDKFLAQRQFGPGGGSPVGAPMGGPGMTPPPPMGGGMPGMPPAGPPMGMKPPMGGPPVGGPPGMAPGQDNKVEQMLMMILMLLTGKGGMPQGPSAPPMGGPPPMPGMGGGMPPRGPM